MRLRTMGIVMGLASLFAAGMGGCPPAMQMPAAVRDPLPTQRPTGLPDGLVRWRKTNLTFFIASFTTKTTEAKQVQLITDAFNRWSAVTPLTFTRVMQRAGADFIVGFGTGTHCELYVASTLTCPADGAFSADTLGHAYFPQGENMGQCHMNDAQNWADDRLLFSTFVHELGHGLGLDHLPETTAVMFASDNGQTGDLQAPDIAAIQRLYGSKDGSVRPSQRTAPPSTDTAANRTAPTTTLPDTDSDGLDDASELYVFGTSRTSNDSDSDGIADGVEEVLGLESLDNDTDNDGTPDGTELDGDGNAFVPDSGLTGDVSALVGKYAGTDSVGTPIEFTVEADGSVAGKLSLTQFGFDEDEELIGRAGGDGRVEVVSYDYFFDYEGTIVAGAVSAGTFLVDDEQGGTWTATKTAKAKSPAATHRTDMAEYEKLRVGRR